LAGCEVIVGQLRDALAKGDVDVRSSLGQKFAAHLKTSHESQKAYAAFKGTSGATAAKKAFRLAWAQKEIQGKVVITKSKLEVLEDKVGHRGIYMAIDRVAVAEGGLENPHAWRRAKNYAMECLQRGPPFVEWNSMKQDTEVLYFEKIRDSIFSTSYTLERCESEVVQNQAAPAAVATSTKPTAAGAAAIDETPVKEVKVIARGNKRGRAGEPAVKKEVPVAKKANDGEEGDVKKMKRDLLKKASDLKKRYHKAVSVQTSIDWNIKHDEKYCWANNPSQASRFKSAVDSLEEAIDADRCCRFFLTNEEEDVKKEWSEGLTSNLHKFAGVALSSAIEGLEKEQIRFNKMHLMNLQG